MSTFTDLEKDAASVDGFVNENGLIETRRNGPKPSYQYLVDGWNTRIDAELDRTTGVGRDNAYETKTAGLAATVDGDYFSVVGFEDSSYLDLYKNNAGVAEFKKSYPSVDGVSAISYAEIENSEKTTYANTVVNGDFITSDPEIRSGSTVVDLTDQDELISRGYKRGINWRLGNEFVISDTGQDINGKYVAGCVLIYSENADNLPENRSVILTADESGSIAELSTSTVGQVVISSKLILSYQYGLVGQVGASKILVGSVSVPVDNTRFASGFFATYQSSEIDIKGVISQVLTQDRCRLSSYKVAEKILSDSVVINQAKLHLGGVNQNSVVTGYSSGDIIERHVAPFPSDTIDETNVFNFVGDYINGSPVKTGSDDVAPQRAFGTTIGANHGYTMGLYDSPSHGKSEPDIGSVYSNGDEFVIVGIKSADQLFIAHRTDNSSSALIGGTFTYVRAGVGSINTGTFNATLVSSKQLYPPFQNRKIIVNVDGLNVSGAGDYNFNSKVKFIESYDVLSRPEVMFWFTDRRKSGEFKPSGRAASYSVSMIYEYDAEGNCTIYSDIAIVESTSITDLMFLQASKGEVDRYYMPKTLPFNRGGFDFNYSLIESASKLTDTGAGTILFTSDRVEQAGIVVDRYVGLNDDNSTYLAVGYLPIQSAESATRRASTSNLAWEIRGNTNKMYPRVIDKGVFTATAGDYFSIVGYRNVAKQSTEHTASYPVRSSSGDYYYLDWHDKSGLQRIELPSDYHGREFEVVEKSSNLTLFSKAVTDSLLVNLNCIGSYSYLCLRMF